jgi:hypothetical protein
VVDQKKSQAGWLGKKAAIPPLGTRGVHNYNNVDAVMSAGRKFQDILRGNSDDVQGAVSDMEFAIGSLMNQELRGMLFRGWRQTQDKFVDVESVQREWPALSSYMMKHLKEHKANNP